MRVDGTPLRSIRNRDGAVEIIDQTKLPWALEWRMLPDEAAAAEAIRVMRVRGAPLIGVTAAYGMALALRADPSDDNLIRATARLLETRPTAVNLRWALERMEARLRPLPAGDRAAAAFAEADAMADEDVALNEAIGRHGLPLLQDIAARKDAARAGRVNVLTHCNAGWLATVDVGTATAPIYAAYDAGIDVHVWVDETRPRNQGAFLTAWELGKHGVPHTVVTDNAGGHLMQHGEVDLVLTGTDRVAANGDVCNKIGTYLKALAAKDNGVPFHVCLPSPTIDWTLADGAAIPIEDRGPDEVLRIGGLEDETVRDVRIAAPGSTAANPAFDVTPARLVTGLITERGRAAPGALAELFPERGAA